jgi:hypothetical protein
VAAGYTPEEPQQQQQQHYEDVRWKTNLYTRRFPIRPKKQCVNIFTIERRERKRGYKKRRKKRRGGMGREGKRRKEK